jgi:hypothetical protein
MNRSSTITCIFSLVVLIWAIMNKLSELFQFLAETTRLIVGISEACYILGDQLAHSPGFVESVSLIKWSLYRAADTVMSLPTQCTGIVFSAYIASLNTHTTIPLDNIAAELVAVQCSGMTKAQASGHNLQFLFLLRGAYRLLEGISESVDECFPFFFGSRRGKRPTCLCCNQDEPCPYPVSKHPFIAS